MAAKAKKTTFAKTGLTKSNIFFAKGNQYTIVHLKQSKTDTEHTRVQMILSATSEQTCSVVTMKRLFIQDPHLPNIPFFRL